MKKTKNITGNKATLQFPPIKMTYLEKGQKGAGGWGLGTEEKSFSTPSTNIRIKPSILLSLTLDTVQIKSRSFSERESWQNFLQIILPCVLYSKAYTFFVSKGLFSFVASK